MPIIPPTLAVPGPCYPRGSRPCLGRPFVTGPAYCLVADDSRTPLPAPVFSGIARQTEGGLFLFLAWGFPSPSWRRKAGGGGPDPTAPRTLPWPAGICPPCLQTGKRWRGAEPSPSPEMTQPPFQHRLPFGLAPFQKPSPPTPFFPAFLLPPPPRLTVTLKHPPLLAPASPRRPKLLPQDRGMRVSSDRPFCPTPLPRIPGATGWQKSKLAPIYPSCLPLNTHKVTFSTHKG
ncbi:glutamate-rich protein 2 isoform X4 [Chamaea fasciata]|uniref:glutamate-rich protein 2 isoform X4 n=1 Tax=Chamaea fasciata TaxID=190680 RepID=UPI00336A1300